MLGFETLTLAPFDRRLIRPDLLNPDETSWLDAYHARVRDALGPDLDAGHAGLARPATRPLTRRPDAARGPASRHRHFTAAPNGRSLAAPAIPKVLMIRLLALALALFGLALPIASAQGFKVPADLVTASLVGEPSAIRPVNRSRSGSA